MKRVIKAATDRSILKSKLAGYEDAICTAIQEQIPQFSIQPENIVIGEHSIDLQNLSIKELMMNVMSHDNRRGIRYGEDNNIPTVSEYLQDPEIVNYVISTLGPTFDMTPYLYIHRDIQSSSASELFEYVIKRIRSSSGYDGYAVSKVVSAIRQYELTVKGNFADPEYYKWMTMKKLFGRNPVFDETGDLESDLDIAYSELESAISEIVPGFSISVDRSDSPRGQFTDVVNFNFANKTRQITLESVDVIGQYASRGVKGLIMLILKRLSGKSWKGVSDISN